MNCERCGGDTMVSYSKRSRKQPVPGSSVDLIKRRRKCLKCDTRFSTFERRSDDSGELWQALEGRPAGEGHRQAEAQQARPARE